MYKYFKSNKRKNEGDCTVRALMVVTGWDWFTVFDKLCVAGREEMAMPSSMRAVEKVALSLGFKKGKVIVEKGSRRPTVSELAKMYPQYTMIARVANHVVGCKGGDYYDTFDSGDYSVYTYFYKS